MFNPVKAMQACQVLRDAARGWRAKAPKFMRRIVLFKQCCPRPLLPPRTRVLAAFYCEHQHTWKKANPLSIFLIRFFVRFLTSGFAPKCSFAGPTGTRNTFLQILRGRTIQFCRFHEDENILQFCSSMFNFLTGTFSSVNRTQIVLKDISKGQTDGRGCTMEAFTDAAAFAARHLEEQQQTDSEVPLNKKRVKVEL